MVVAMMDDETNANMRHLRELTEKLVFARFYDRTRELFLDNSPVVAFIKDAGGRMMYVNSQYEQKFHTPLAAVKGKNDYELWPKATADQLRQHDLSILGTDKVLETVENVPTPDGILRPWLVYKFSFIDEADKQPYIGGVGVDLLEVERIRRQHESDGHG